MLFKNKLNTQIHRRIRSKIRDLRHDKGGRSSTCLTEGVLDEALPDLMDSGANFQRIRFLGVLNAEFEKVSPNVSGSSASPHTDCAHV